MVIMEFEQTMRDFMATTSLPLIMFWILAATFAFAVLSMLISVGWVSREIARELEEEKNYVVPVQRSESQPFHYHDVA